MKSITLLLLLFIQIFSMENTFPHYKTNSGVFSFNFPKGWSIQEINLSTVLVKAPLQKEYVPRFSLMFQVMPSNVTENQYLEISLQQLRSIYPDFKLVKTEKTIISGQNAVTIEEKYTEKGNVLRGYSIILIDNNVAYTINAIALERKWIEFWKIFQIVKKSIQIYSLGGENKPSKI